MAEFQIYRLRIFESPLFPLQRTRRELISLAIREKPTISPSSNKSLKKSKWHIGNIESLGNDAFAFAVGRQSPTAAPKYNEETKDFYSALEDDAPFSIIIVDAGIGLVAIMVKPDVGTPDTIASRLKQLLMSTDTIKQDVADISIDPIYDSNLFINLLRNAYQIKRFIFDFYPPNPEDAEMDIQLPAEQWAQRTNAQHGRISIDGPSLIKSAIEPVARGVINSGSQAIAVVRENRNSKKVRRISSKTQRVATEVSRVSIDSRDNLSSALDSIREVYYSNRGEFSEG